MKNYTTTDFNLAIDLLLNRVISNLKKDIRFYDDSLIGSHGDLPSNIGDQEWVALAVSTLLANEIAWDPNSNQIERELYTDIFLKLQNTIYEIAPEEVASKCYRLFD